MLSIALLAIAVYPVRIERFQECLFSHVKQRLQFIQLGLKANTMPTISTTIANCSLSS